MALIPDNDVTQKDLSDWYTLAEELRVLKTKELLLRNKIYNGLFVKKDEHGNDILPKEGTNKYKLPDNYELKAQRVVNRTPDEASIQALRQELADLLERGANENLTDEEIDRARMLQSLPIDDLIRYKPELVTGNYRTLTEEQRKVFDAVLVIKEGTPQLEIVLPKRRT